MTWVSGLNINEKVRNEVTNCRKSSQKALGHKITNSLLFVVRCFGSRKVKEVFKIEKGERFYISYVFRLKSSLIGVLAKELANGKIDFILVAQRDNKPKVLMKVENLEREHYHAVAQAFAQTLAYEHSLVDVRAICPKHCKRLSKVG